MKNLVKNENSKPTKLDGSKEIKYSGEVVSDLINSIGSEDIDILNSTIKDLAYITPFDESKNPVYLNASIAMIHDFRPTDSFERMLVIQIVACHHMIMRFSASAMVPDQYIDAVDKNINRAAKLMRAFNSHCDALQRYRGKGHQTIKVQHINVQDDAQAIVGNVEGGK